jgi:hypothetical protein
MGSARVAVEKNLMEMENVCIRATVTTFLWFL